MPTNATGLDRQARHIAVIMSSSGTAQPHQSYNS
jgi:hypothetical protein